jgi:Ca2+/Na+ antiporter
VALVQVKAIQQASEILNSVSQSQVRRMTFKVPQMDCAAEEQLVRLQLADDADVLGLTFDLGERTLVVTSKGDGTAVEASLRALNLGARLVETDLVGNVTSEADRRAGEEGRQRSLLVVVLLINVGLFVLEMGIGLVAGSMGLVADSLDMLADAFVYGLSIYAVGKAAKRKVSVARVSGYLQLLLALFGMFEVLRRFLGGDEAPDFVLMIVVSLVALAGNAVSLLVLRRAQSQEAHFQASWIFTTNDVIVNLGVIAAGVLVFATGSAVPDLVVGAIVFVLVSRGALRILAIAR